MPFIRQKRRSKFWVWRSPKDSLWYWHLVGSNREIVCQSEGYATKSSALRATRRLLSIVDQAEGA